MQYREATIADIPAIAGIRASVWETKTYWINRITAYMSGEHHPQQALLPRIVYVALEEENVVGFIAGHLTRRYECNGELEWINVTAENQQKRIASTLLVLLARWFVMQQSPRICVNADPENTVAVNFYKRHGAKEFNKYWLIWEDISIVLKER